MTRRSVVVAIVALFVGVLPVSCSKSPTAPTDPPPIVIVPAAPGSPAVLSVPSVSSRVQREPQSTGRRAFLSHGNGRCCDSQA